MITRRKYNKYGERVTNNKPIIQRRQKMTLTLTPAYGRDYKSIAEVKQAFNNNMDFVIETIFSPHCGRYCNKSDLSRDNQKSVKIRYGKLRKVTVINF